MAGIALVGLVASSGSAQTHGNTVLGWRVGASVGAVEVVGNFQDASPSLSTGVTADFLGRNGWGIGVGADLGAHDPSGGRFRIHTFRLSPRYSHVGTGAGYYRFIGFDLVAGHYRSDNSDAPTVGKASATGYGFGTSIGAGGFVGGDGPAMELSLSYARVAFRDATLAGGPLLARTAAVAHVFRLTIGFWFG